MNHLFRTFALTALFLATQAPAAIVTVDRVVAVVNRSAITRQELDERASTIRQNLVKQGVTAPAADVLENEALQRMITERVLLQQAANVANPFTPMTPGGGALFMDVTAAGRSPTTTANRIISCFCESRFVATIR